MKKAATIALILVLVIIMAWAIMGFILWNWNPESWDPYIRAGVIGIILWLLAVFPGSGAIKRK